jgi:hypothetical protein
LETLLEAEHSIIGTAATSLAQENEPQLDLPLLTDNEWKSLLESIAQTSSMATTSIAQPSTTTTTSNIVLLNWLKTIRLLSSIIVTVHSVSKVLKAYTNMCVAYQFCLQFSFLFD